MTYPKKELTIITECNDENGNPTCWAFVEHEGIWITKYDDDYIVETENGYNLAGVAYKTLAGAKRKAEEIAFRRANA